MDYVRWFRYALISAAGIVLLTLAMLVVAPTYQDMHWMPEGFFTPIMVFEYMQSDAQASRFFAGDPKLMAAMRHTVLLDMGFLLSYGLFLSLCAIACYAYSGRRVILLAVGLACAGALFDALENLQLLSIIAAQHQAEPFTHYALLTNLVNAKFISLTLACLLMVPVVWSFGWRGQVFGGCIAISMACAGVNLVHPAYSAEIILLSTTVSWVMLMLIAWRVPQAPASVVGDIDQASRQTNA